ncbi:MAG: BCD family MFS transporter [Alphaproteobacteria bacterium]
MASAHLGWFGIIRVGLVQAALGGIVVLTTSTINRLMIVELALPALVPGLLVTWHYALQILRPRWGHGSDQGARRTPWIIGGMAILALGGALASLSVGLTATSTIVGLGVAFIAFTLIGVGVGAAGTSLLIFLASHVEREKRAAAATIVWIMMIVGFILTSAFVGHFLDPFTPLRLVSLASAICGIAFLISLIALYRLEPHQKQNTSSSATDGAAKPEFREAFSHVWRMAEARRFAIFVFISMLAYSAQDLILEPFAALRFGLTPGQTASLSGMQNGGVLMGMILVGVLATLFNRNRFMELRNWVMLGCFGSSLALIGLVVAARMGPPWPISASVFALGFANGVYAVAAIGSMFSSARAEGAEHEGLRMGLFGAAQAVAFGLGGVAGTGLSDFFRIFMDAPEIAYASVFAIEALLFVIAAWLATSIGRHAAHSENQNPLVLAAGHEIGVEGR